MQVFKRASDKYLLYRHTLVGTAYFNAFSDGYIVGEFGEIPWQEIGTGAIMDMATLERGWFAFIAGPSDFAQCRSSPAPGF